MNSSVVWNIISVVWEKITSIDFSSLWEVPLTILHDFLTSNQSMITKENDSYLIYSREPIREFNVRIVTWNVFSKPPPPASKILNLMNLMDDVPSDGADFYAIGFQEHPKGLFKIGARNDDPWIRLLKEALTGRGYVLLKFKEMHSIMLICFAKRKHILHVRNIECQQTRTGGVLSKKGAVSIRLSISGCEVCFINSHLTSEESATEERFQDYHQILDRHRYQVEMCPDILSHDIIFWFGDLNFRLNHNNSNTAEYIEKLIRTNERDKLLEFDELRHHMKEQRIFQEFFEKLPNFPPTYKFETESPYYDLKQKPAWTDRILYRIKSSPYANIIFLIEQEFYTSYAQCKISDHRPVASEFNVKFAEIPNQVAMTDLEPSDSTTSPRIFVDLTERIVEFNHIPYWIIDDNNTIEYFLPCDFTEHPGLDWVGLFHSDFDDLSSYISCQQVSADPESPESTSPIPVSHGLETLNRGPWRKRTMSMTVATNNIPADGRYVLLYFEQDESGACGAAGISNSFTAVFANQVRDVNVENSNLKSI